MSVVQFLEGCFKVEDELMDKVNIYGDITRCTPDEYGCPNKELCSRYVSGVISGTPERSPTKYHSYIDASSSITKPDGKQCDMFLPIES